MTRRETMAPLLDAFDEDRIRPEDPGNESPPHHAEEAATARILQRLMVEGQEPADIRPNGPQARPEPARSSAPWMVGAVAAAVMIVAGTAVLIGGAALRHDPQPAGGAAPVVQQQPPSPVEPVVDVPAVDGPAPPVPSALATATPPDVTGPSEQPPEPEVFATPGELGAGLTATEDTRVSVLADAAVLTRGVLTFVRTDQIRPPVETVTWANLPLVAQPIGTVFISGAAGDVAVVLVQEGRLRLMHTDGGQIGELAAGESAVIVVDEGAAHGLDAIPIGGLGLDEITVRLHQGIDPGTARTLVVQTRLSALSPASVKALQDFGDHNNRQ